jgi:hypothetical protein
VRGSEFAAGSASQPSLTDHDRQILDFAGKTYRHEGAKWNDVSEQFGMNLTRYYQRLNTLIDHPEAAAYAPQTVNRYRRQRDASTAKRDNGPRLVQGE